LKAANIGGWRRAGVRTQRSVESVAYVIDVEVHPDRN
jgi:hypothetical protein